jgi:nucleoside-diphosphate-sugar epimerase
MLLDISKIKRLGWYPRYSGREAVEEATKALLLEV